MRYLSLLSTSCSGRGSVVVDEQKIVFSLWCTFVSLLLSLILNFLERKNINISWEHKVDTWHFQEYFFRKKWISENLKFVYRGFFYQDTHHFVPCLISLNCSESQETLGIATLRSKHVIKNDKKEGWGCCRDSFSFEIVFPDLKLFFSFFFFFFYLCTIYFYPNPMTVKR